jgi:hypothetical protein
MILHRTTQPSFHLPIAQYILVETVCFQSQDSLSAFTVCCTAGGIHLASRAYIQNRHSKTFSVIIIIVGIIVVVVIVVVVCKIHVARACLFMSAPNTL